MSQPRFLADHDLRDPIVRGVLRGAPDVAFLRLREVNLHASPDEEVLQYAAQHRLLVVSHDESTMPATAYERMRAGREMVGLFVSAQTDPMGPIIECLVAIAMASEAEEWHSMVVRLPF